MSRKTVLQKAIADLERRVALLENAEVISYIEKYAPEGWGCYLEYDWDNSKQITCEVRTPDGKFMTRDLRMVAEMFKRENDRQSKEKPF